MGSYGWYLISAYGIVGILLAAQWFMPWRRFRNYLRQNAAPLSSLSSRDDDNK